MRSTTRTIKPAPALVCSCLLTCVLAVPAFSKDKAPGYSARDLVVQLKAIARKNGLSISQSSFDVVLGKLSQNEDETAQELIEGLADENESERRACALVLKHLSKRVGFHVGDRSVATIISTISSSEDWFVKENLIRVLGNVGAQTSSVKPTLYEIVDSKSSTIRLRRVAVEALAKIARMEPQEKRVESTRIFLSMASSEVPSLRVAGLLGLKGCRQQRDKLLPALSTALNDNYLKVRSAAAFTLKDYGPEASRLIPKLVNMIEMESDQSIRAYCVHALQSIGKQDDQVVSKFIELLDDRSIATTVLNHIWGFGPVARKAAPRIARFLDDRNPYNRQCAVMSLGYIGGPDCIPLVTKALRDGNPQVRSRAVRALSMLKRRAQQE